MNLNHLEIFYRVADTLSFTRAAEHLLVSQPAVSKQIKELELALKVKLFDRAKRTVSLTSEGEILFEYSARIFTLASQAELALNDVSALRRGRLDIGASPTLGTYLLPAVLVRYRRRFP